MKKFEIPEIYRSSIISKIKEDRRLEDPRKRDFKPTELNFGPIRFLIARHFGFCYGVENAIEISYKAIDENPGKNIYLLSEMIHNPNVNKDLLERGLSFIMDNYGRLLIPWDKITSEDIVIIPAFGTTRETEKLLKQKNSDTRKYNTTCPFVEKVWNRSEVLGKQNYTIIIHGKEQHEETRATYSHATEAAKAVIVKNIEEAKILSEIILDRYNKKDFYDLFKGKYSEGFDLNKDLCRIGVVNQTTMLAAETQAISDLLKETMIKKYGKKNLKEHFADTRDTLCYATNDNQSSTKALLEYNIDLAIVLGGYNSSNTTHLVELLENKFPTYFISDCSKIKSNKTIHHFDRHTQVERVTNNFLPEKDQITIAITSGASCPDKIVDETLVRIISFYE